MFADYSLALYEPITTEKVVLVADQHYVMVDMSRGKQLEQLYNDSKTVATFVGNTQGYDISLYPYTSLKVNYEESPIEIREK